MQLGLSASAVMRSTALATAGSRSSPVIVCQALLPRCAPALRCLGASTSAARAPQQQSGSQQRAQPPTAYSGSGSPYVGATPEYAYPSAPEMPQERMGEAARKALTRATQAVMRWGWLSFWVQLTLSVVSGVILLFSVAFTSQTGPRASLYLTLVGILAGFLSTAWNFGYTRTGLTMQEYLDAPPNTATPKVKKQQVMDMVTKGIVINLMGLGSTLLGVSALVGILVAKTLSNASANPFIASAAGIYNPVLALDVFLVQAATNTLIGHFFSLCCSLFLLNVVGEGRGLRFQSPRDKSDSPTGSLSEGTVQGNAGTYRVNY